MSSRRWIGVALLIAPAALHGQDVAAYERLQDATLARIEVAQARAAARGADAVAATPHVEVAGVVAVRTDDASRTLAARIAHAADSLLRLVPLPPDPTDVLFTLRRAERRRPGDVVDTVTVLAEVARGELRNPQAFADPDALVSAGALLVRDRLLRDAPWPRLLRDWLGTAIPDTAPGNIWPIARTRLATAGVQVTRNCFQGVLATCAELMAVAPSGDRVLRWLTADERRWLEGVWSGVGRSFDCASGDDAACVERLRGQNPDRLADFGGRELRRGLLVTALQYPGAPGLAALAVDSLDALPLVHEAFYPVRVRAVLEAIAGAPLDSLLPRWHARVRAADARAVPPRPLTVAVMALWIVTFGVIATRGRSL
jgi:hypothetical protein